VALVSISAFIGDQVHTMIYAEIALPLATLTMAKDSSMWLNKSVGNALELATF
jgi:hypothetical protein